MLHNKISKSLQVDNLSLPAQLLFSWMISWADDEGRIRGEPKYIKGTVVPLKNWSLKHIGAYIESMRDQGLIYYWSENSEQYIEFAKWKEHQSIKSDRFKPSELPSYSELDGNNLSPNSIHNVSKTTPQSNISESNSIEVNKSELNEVEQIAVKNTSYKGNTYMDRNPDTFEPQTPGDAMAKEVWEKLEPTNRWSFYSTYLKPIRKGLPPDVLYQFCSEIKQDPTVKEPGKVMNKKISDYFKGKETEVKQ